MSAETTSPREPREPTNERDEKIADLRGRTTTTRDLSEHRRHAWLYEDLLN
ncbi:hypothetical protein SAMN05421759_102107 [Roseivivax lentus]|uniref:Uncharacterized protein n=1 Tax=Roseivivax lentus TaxID=633194 RepID=A0A1N7KVG5_9RHOB|nr:hypothetical protein [Roseivivax lentus]SIS65585.1 hypothetical protein SAMN05421759_102107 [Roseivivax lentus]